jgi:hypothetical protein
MSAHLLSRVNECIELNSVSKVSLCTINHKISLRQEIVNLLKRCWMWASTSCDIARDTIKYLPICVWFDDSKESYLKKVRYYVLLWTQDLGNPALSSITGMFRNADRQEVLMVPESFRPVFFYLLSTSQLHKLWLDIVNSGLRRSWLLAVVGCYQNIIP